MNTYRNSFDGFPADRYMVNQELSRAGARKSPGLLLKLVVACLALTACGESIPHELGIEVPVSAAELPPLLAGAPQSLAVSPAAPAPAPRISQPWTGDLDGMIERRVVRVLTVYGPPRYFLDGGTEKGATYELFRQFEDHLNEGLKKGQLKVHMIFIPVSRDRLIPWLVEGRGDIASAGLTITPERQSVIDFSSPVTKPLAEILVTGPFRSGLHTLGVELKFVRWPRRILSTGRRAAVSSSASSTIPSPGCVGAGAEISAWSCWRVRITPFETWSKIAPRPPAKREATALRA